MKTAFRLTLALCAGLLITACSGTPEEHEDADVCEHLQEGPVVEATATGTEAGAPELKGGHQRTDLTLVDVDGGKGGVVKFVSREQADYVLALDADVPVAVLDAAGAPVAFESSATSSTACTQIKRRHVVELGVGTFSLSFGPTTAEKVGVLIVETGGHHGH